MLFFFFNDPAPTEIYTLSLHDALPILGAPGLEEAAALRSALEKLERVLGPDLLEGLTGRVEVGAGAHGARKDRKSTRLNSSHTVISYAVFCLKKKKKNDRKKRNDQNKG